MTIDSLLAEAPIAARRRERLAFQDLAGDAKDKLVLFGAGQLGRKMLGVLRRHGMEPLAFADSQPALQNTRIEGVEVLAPEEAARRHGRSAVFVATIFRGSGDRGMASRLRFLKRIGCEHTASFLPLAWKHPAGLLPHYGAELPSLLLAAAPALAATAAVWTDEISRELFRAQLLWRLRDNFSGLKTPAPDQYFPADLLIPRPDEAFVDGGAYDGDTLRSLGRNFARAWAIEPDPDNAARLRARADPRVEVLECALGAAPESAQFSSGQGVSSALSPSGGINVRVETLDHLLAGESPTFLKLDIEGSEEAALHGARELLGRSQPVVAACLYHRPEDLWRIPLLLREQLPNHRLFLRAHQNDGFELVAYALPPGRLP